MTSKFSEILLPSIVCIIVYLIINKLFPEKVESLGKDPIETLGKDPIETLRGGDRIKLAKTIAEKLLKFL